MDDIPLGNGREPGSSDWCHVRDIPFAFNRMVSSSSSRVFVGLAYLEKAMALLYRSGRGRRRIAITSVHPREPS